MENLNNKFNDFLNEHRSSMDINTFNFLSREFNCAVTHYPYIVGPLAQVCSELKIDKKGDNDFYEEHFNKLKDNFDLGCNVLEVCSGILPVFSNLIAAHQIKIGVGTITAFDPKLFMQMSKYKNMKLHKEKVTLQTDISGFDLVTAILPCEATEDVLTLACQNQKDFYIALCGCEHGNDEYEDYMYSQPHYERMINVAKKLVKENNNGTLVIDKLSDKYNYDYPILYNKRK